MDDILDNWTDRVVNKIKSRLPDILMMFDIENALPLQLTGKQCQKLLGIGNYTEFLRVTSLPNFPKIEKGKGHNTYYPRDAVRAWYNDNWKLIAKSH